MFTIMYSVYRRLLGVFFLSGLFLLRLPFPFLHLALFLVGEFRLGDAGGDVDDQAVEETSFLLRVVQIEVVLQVEGDRRQDRLFRLSRRMKQRGRGRDAILARQKDARLCHVIPRHVIEKAEPRGGGKVARFSAAGESDAMAFVFFRRR